MGLSVPADRPPLPDGGYEWLPVGALIPGDSRTFFCGEWFGTAPTTVGMRQGPDSPPRVRRVFPAVGVQIRNRDPKEGLFFNVLLPGIDFTGAGDQSFWVMVPEAFIGLRDEILRAFEQARFDDRPEDQVLASLAKKMAELLAHYVRSGVLYRRP